MPLTEMTAADRRWRQYPLAIIVAVLAAVLIATLGADGGDGVTGRLGGDFVEFHGAGRIVADGDADQLYDPARQADAQADLFGGEADGGGILFAYPAVVAAPYAATESLGFETAYLIHTTAMLAAFALALRLLQPLLPALAVNRYRPAAVAYALTFLPLFTGLTGGQNTGLTLLALGAVWWGLDRGRDELAGLAAGLLLVKPQYGLPICGLLLLARRPRALAGAAVGAAGVWSGSALVAGPGWTGDWLDLARSLSDVDGGANVENEVSWLGLAQAAMGHESAVASTVGYLAAALTVGALLVVLRRRPLLDPITVAVVVPSLLLAAPHSLFYDAGLILVPVAALVPTVPPERRPVLLGAVWLAGLGHLANGLAGFEPVALAVIAIWLWALRCAVTGPSITRRPDELAARQR